MIIISLHSSWFTPKMYVSLLLLRLYFYLFMCICIYVCVSLYVCALHNPRFCCEFWCWQLYFLLHFTGHFPFLYVTAFVWVCCDCMCVRVCACNFLIFSHLSKFTGNLRQHSLCPPPIRPAAPAGQRKVKLKPKLKKEEEMAAIPLCVRASVCVCMCVSATEAYMQATHSFAHQYKRSSLHLCGSCANGKVQARDLKSQKEGNS